jgi:hypothetical protein
VPSKSCVSEKRHQNRCQNCTACTIRVLNNRGQKSHVDCFPAGRHRSAREQANFQKYELHCNGRRKIRTEINKQHRTQISPRVSLRPAALPRPSFQFVLSQKDPRAHGSSRAGPLAFSASPPFRFFRSRPRPATSHLPPHVRPPPQRRRSGVPPPAEPDAH